MKTFFKMLLASVIGVLLASLLSFFVVAGIVGSIVSMSTQESEVAVKSKSILRIMLDKPVIERSESSFVPDFLNSSVSMETAMGLAEILKSLKNAVSDPNITMIYMDLSVFSAEGVAQIEEIRAELIRFKESGKPIIAYADNYSQPAYYLASVADKIYLNPFGNALLQGVRAEVLFYKKALEKLQVDVQIIRHGKFKSAVEPFMGERMSDENREQTLSFANGIWNHWLSEISKCRQIDVNKLQSLADDLSLFSAQAALDNRLVDGILYKDELLAELCKLSSVSNEEKLSIVDIEKYVKTVKPGKMSKNKIAVVYANGDIVQGKSSSGISAWEYANILRRLRNDSLVKAVVFRVNSPGGDAQASEIIARELALIKEIKPVVVSMGNYAASGGYWISAPSHLIITNPTTLTGSIGVFGIVPNLQKGMGNLLGISVDVAKTAQLADFPSVYRPMTERERDVMQGYIEEIYTNFVDRVASNRSLSAQKVDSVGQGRVWCGLDAVRLGLADRLGGITEAIDAAAMLAELSDYRTVELPTIQSPIDQLFQSFFGGNTKAKNVLPKPIEQAQKLVNTLSEPHIMARVPFDVEIY